MNRLRISFEDKSEVVFVPSAAVRELNNLNLGLSSFDQVIWYGWWAARRKGLTDIVDWEDFAEVAFVSVEPDPVPLELPEQPPA